MRKEHEMQNRTIQLHDPTLTARLRAALHAGQPRLFAQISGAVMMALRVAAAELPPLDHNQVVDYQPAGENLLANGSFELGLGAEPFYPGWNMPTRGNLPTDAPQPPVLDRPGANGSVQCLKLGGITGGKHGFIDVSPPPVHSFPGARHFISVWNRMNYVIVGSQALHAAAILDTELPV